MCWCSSGLWKLLLLGESHLSKWIMFNTLENSNLLTHLTWWKLLSRAYLHIFTDLEKNLWRGVSIWDIISQTHQFFFVRGHTFRTYISDLPMTRDGTYFLQWAENNNKYSCVPRPRFQARMPEWRANRFCFTVWSRTTRRWGVTTQNVLWPHQVGV